MVLLTSQAQTEEPPSRLARAERRWAIPALLALLLAGGGVLLYAGRLTGFYYDEWNFVLQRRAWTLDALLKPHNEHLSLVPVLVYKLLFELFGLGSYVPYRVSVIALGMGIAALLFVYARPRVGATLALAAAAVVLLLGQAYIDILWPFQIGFLGSLACGLGALLALDRGTRRAEFLASALITGALASSSLGLPLLAAFAIEILGRPDRRARWWILLAPVVLYALWYVTYGVSEGITLDNAFATPHYVTEAGAGAAGAVTGLDSNWGRPLLLAFAVVLGFAVRRVTAVPWRLAALVTAPLAFWVATGLARANLNEPAASRYLYPGALLLILVAAEAAAGRRASGRALVLILVLAAASIVSNVGTLRGGAGFLRDQNAMLGGALAATEIGGNRLPPAFMPAPVVAPQVSAGPYLAAVRDLGSPAPSAVALRTDVESARVAADDALVRGYALALTPLPAATGSGAPPQPVGPATAATVAPSGACLVVTPQAPTASVVVTVPPGGLNASGVGPVALARWADEFHAPLPLPAGAAVSLRIPRDGDPTPWRATLPITGPARICTAG
jgi:hypothetical protein